MAIEIFVLITSIVLLFTSVVAWTIKLAGAIPAMQDMMPIDAHEQFFIVFAKPRADKK